MAEMLAVLPAIQSDAIAVLLFGLIFSKTSSIIFLPLSLVNVCRGLRQPVRCRMQGVVA